MAGVNKVILLGNLGQDPEVRYLESGSVVANIRLATTERYKDREGNQREITEWHDVEMWEGLAKVAEKYLKKGDSIFVEGKIKTDKWEDNDGNNRKAVKIRAQNMTMLSKASGGNSNSGNYEQSNGGDATLNDPPAGGKDVDDLPF